MKGLLIALVFLFSGCASTQPSSIMTLLHTPLPTEKMSRFSDYSILVLLDKTLESYGTQSTLSGQLATGGALGIGALATVAFATAGSPGVSQGFMVAGNALLMALGILKPADDHVIYSQGSKLLQDAVGEYAIALIDSGYCTVPTTFATPQGAILLQKTMAAQGIVGDMLAKKIPRSEDYKSLSTSQSMSGASARRGLLSDTGCN
jgi:hypothetical protein